MLERPRRQVDAYDENATLGGVRSHGQWSRAGRVEPRYDAIGDRLFCGIFEDPRVRTLLALLKQLSDSCVRNLYEGAYAAVKAGKGKSLRQAFLDRVAVMKDWGFEKQRECATRTLEVHGAHLSNLYLKSLELYLTQVLVREKRATGKIVASGVPPFEAFLHHFYCKLLDTQEVRELSYLSSGTLDRTALVQDCLLATFYDYVPRLSVTQVVAEPNSPRDYGSPIPYSRRTRGDFDGKESPRSSTSKWGASPRQEPLEEMFSPRMAKFPTSRERPKLPVDRIPSISTVIQPRQETSKNVTPTPARTETSNPATKDAATIRTAPQTPSISRGPISTKTPSQPVSTSQANQTPSRPTNTIHSSSTSKSTTPNNTNPQQQPSTNVVVEEVLKTESSEKNSLSVQSVKDSIGGNSGSRAFVKAAEIVVAAPAEAEI